MRGESNVFSNLPLSCYVPTLKAAAEMVCDQGTQRQQVSPKEVPMFLILAIVLVVAWLGGFIMFKSAGLLIHLLLVFAVISLIMHFVTGRRTV